MTRPIVHFEIRGRDPKRLREFYQALFGWNMTVNEALNYTLIEHGIGGPPEGVGGGIAPADTPSVSVYVQVVDPVETLRKAEELGGQKVMDPMDVPGGPTIAQLKDPEGNLVGLIKQ